MVQRHLHTTLSWDCKLLYQIWSDGSQQEVGGPTHEEEEVGGLRVVDPWDPFEEGGMLSTLLHEELLDEFRVTYWDTQHPQSLLERGEVWISLPDNGIWLHPSGCPGEVLHPFKLDATTVPDLCFAEMDLDPGVRPQFFSHNGVGFCDPVWFRCGKNDVVQEYHHLLSVPQPRLCLDKGLVLSQCKEHGHEGVALPPAQSHNSTLQKRKWPQPLTSTH